MSHPFFCLFDLFVRLYLHIFSDLPLSALVSKICAELETEHGFSWSSEAVCAKIKLLSQRRSYFDVKKKCVNKVACLLRLDVVVT